jgi:hypothetical protein
MTRKECERILKSINPLTGDKDEQRELSICLWVKLINSCYVYDKINDLDAYRENGAYKEHLTDKELTEIQEKQLRYLRAKCKVVVRKKSLIW